MVTSERYVRALADAPVQQFSLHAVAEEVFPLTSLVTIPDTAAKIYHGFEWKDQRGVEGTGFVRALRSLLIAHLPSLLPSLSASIVEGLDSEVSWCKRRNGMSDEARLSADILSPKARCSYIPIFLMIKRVVPRAYCFSSALSSVSLILQHNMSLTSPARNRDFTAAALDFPQAVIFAPEILRITPSFYRAE